MMAVACNVVLSVFTGMVPIYYVAFFFNLNTGSYVAKPGLKLDL